MNYGAAFEKLCGIVERLRGEGGCPWDREQTPQTLRGDLIEETYECIEAIDEGDPAHAAEELGDLFLLVTMLSYMYQQEGAFSISGVLEGIAEKLVRRHPHVFGELREENLAGSINTKKVLDNWERIKVEQEGRLPKDSALDGIPRSLPPLDRAWKLQKKAAKQGFDWPALAGVLDKVKEELAEVEEAIPEGIHHSACQDKLEEELGDLLFSAVNLCRFLKVEPSLALRRANAKFSERFKYVEKKMKENGLPMAAENLEIMDRHWNEAKVAMPAGS